MVARQLKTIIFSAFAMAALSVGSTALAAPDFEAAQELELLYGDGDAVHEPGLPQAGMLRVYWFWSAVSSCSERAEPGIESLVSAFPDVEVIVVHSNADEEVDEARDVASSRQVGAPIYRDEGALLADIFNATMTPEVVVVDHTGVIYQGRPVKVGRRSMESYVEDIAARWRASEEIERDYRRPTGCPIRRP